MAHRVPFIVRKGEVKCVTCGKTQALEKQSNPKKQTIPPGAPWVYPKGWLVGALGWYCCQAHVKAPAADARSPK
jgi:hypothetical protein